MRNAVLPLLTILLFLLGCAERPRGNTDPTARQPAAEEVQTPQPSAAEENGYSVSDEGPAAEKADVQFEEDVLPPPEDSPGESFQQSKPASESLPEQGEKIQPSVDSPVEPNVRAQPTDPNAAPDYDVVLGFRVQLSASGSSADAHREADKARTRLGTDVYVEFEAPLYKVRAGDFRDRAEAVTLRARARGNGYPEAWVVETEIRIPAGGGT